MGGNLMNLLVIGGYERMEKDYMVMVKKKGYKIKVYIIMLFKLNNFIGRLDVVVIFILIVLYKMFRMVEF